MVRQLPGFLTLKEAAERAGLSPITLRIQIRNGRIKATKVGRDWVITRDELRAYLKSVGK
jgi:excisionase family DNA binding protein